MRTVSNRVGRLLAALTGVPFLYGGYRGAMVVTPTAIMRGLRIACAAQFSIVGAPTVDRAGPLSRRGAAAVTPA